MSVKDFMLIQKLGDGAYSSVYKVRRLADNVEYALKRVKLPNLSDKEQKNALNEVRILASVKNPNIIEYKEAFIDEPSQSLCIVMEYADDGDLFQKIVQHKKNGTYFGEPIIWQIFIQIVRGLRSLHDLKIMHRDLKSANVFLNKNKTVKLGDMNVSKVLKKGLSQTQTGTPYYASPEVWRDMPYDTKSDIWSLGCVLYQSIMLKPPFRAEDMQGLYKKVVKGSYPKIPPPYSKDMSDIVKMLLQVSPHLRPSCDRIMCNPIVGRRIERYFPNGELKQAFVNSDNILMQTIKIPKNLLYLSDRLPKPSYQGSPKDRGSSPQGYSEDDAKRLSPLVRHPSEDKLPSIKANSGIQALRQAQKRQKEVFRKLQKKVAARKIIPRNGQIPDASSPDLISASIRINGLQSPDRRGQSPLHSGGGKGLSKVDSQHTIQTTGGISEAAATGHSSRRSPSITRAVGTISPMQRELTEARSLSPTNILNREIHRNLPKATEIALAASPPPGSGSVNPPSKFKNTSSLPEVSATPTPPPPPKPEDVHRIERVKLGSDNSNIGALLQKYKSASRSPSMTPSPPPIKQMVTPARYKGPLESYLESKNTLKGRDLLPSHQSPPPLPSSLHSKLMKQESGAISSGRSLMGSKLRAHRKIVKAYGAGGSGPGTQVQSPAAARQYTIEIMKKRLESVDNFPREPRASPEPIKASPTPILQEAKNYLMRRGDGHTRLPKLPQLKARGSQPGSSGLVSRNSSVPKYENNPSEQLHVFKRQTPKMGSVAPSTKNSIEQQGAAIFQARKFMRELGQSPQAPRPSKLRPMRIGGEPMASPPPRLSSLRASAASPEIIPLKAEDAAANSLKQKRSSMPVLEGDNSLVANANQVLEILS